MTKKLVRTVGCCACMVLGEVYGTVQPGGGVTGTKLYSTLCCPCGTPSCLCLEIQGCPRIDGFYPLATNAFFSTPGTAPNWVGYGRTPSDDEVAISMDCRNVSPFDAWFITIDVVYTAPDGSRRGCHFAGQSATTLHLQSVHDCGRQDGRMVYLAPDYQSYAFSLGLCGDADPCPLCPDSVCGDCSPTPGCPITVIVHRRACGTNGLLTECCSLGLPATLYLAVPGCAAVAGTYALMWDGSRWFGTTDTGDHHLTYFVRCAGGATCDSLRLTFLCDGIPMVDDQAPDLFGGDSDCSCVNATIANYTFAVPDNGQTCCAPGFPFTYTLGR